MNAKQQTKVFDILDNCRAGLVGVIAGQTLPPDTLTRILNDLTGVRLALDELVFNWHIDALATEDETAQELIADCAWKLHELEAKQHG